MRGGGGEGGRDLGYEEFSFVWIDSESVFAFDDLNIFFVIDSFRYQPLLLFDITQLKPLTKHKPHGELSHR